VFGGVVGGGVLIGRVWTGLAAVVSPMQSYEIAAPAGHLLVSSYAVHPHAGVRLGARKWLELTGGIEIASVGASFDAISAPTPSRFLRLSPSVGAAMMVPVTHSVFVRLFATAMVPIVRPRYVVTLAGNDQELYRTALVLAQLGLGLEFRP
jgi:hypothetical protein